MTFQIIRQDIKEVEADIIVNAANKDLQRGGGVCGAIFQGANDKGLEEECKKLAPIETGQAVITKAYNLRAKYIIHTAGPIYSEDHKEEAVRLLGQAYRSSLKLAKDYKAKSIVFPLISAGIYGFPKNLAYQIAKEEISKFLLEEDMNVRLIVTDPKILSISDKVLGDFKDFVASDYFKDKAYTRRARINDERRYASLDYLKYKSEKNSAKESKEEDLDTYIGKSYESMVDEIPKGLKELVDRKYKTFSQSVFRLIDKSGKTDPEVYNKVYLDRKLFSKIRTNKDYRPTKLTALKIAVGLELNLDQTVDLLEKAGFALSKNSLVDKVFSYFIEIEKYDILEIEYWVDYLKENKAV